MAILDILEGKTHHELYTLFIEQSFPAELVQEAFHQMELQVRQPGTDRWKTGDLFHVEFQLVSTPTKKQPLVDGGNLHFF